MKKKKIAAIVTSVALIAAVGIGATLAYFTDKDTKQNVITMGKVDGSLDETTNSEDGKKPGTETPDKSGMTYDKIQPGDVLSKEPSITLDENSEDAYARMKITISIEGLAAGTNSNAYIEKLEENMNIPDSWTKGDEGYYYFNTKLSNKEGGVTSTGNIFTTVTIPTEWGNEISNAKITIKLDAELIQADNFEDKIKRDISGMINGWDISAEDIKAYTTK